MSLFNENFCAIYISNRLSFDAMQLAVADCVGGQANLGAIDTDWAEFYLDENDEFDARAALGEEGFLYFPYRLDAELATNSDPQLYRTKLRELLIRLRGLGWQCVPACEFEEYLNQP